MTDYRDHHRDGRRASPADDRRSHRDYYDERTRERGRFQPEKEKRYERHDENDRYSRRDSRREPHSSDRRDREQQYYSHRSSKRSQSPPRYERERSRPDSFSRNDRRDRYQDAEPVKFDRQRRLSPFRGDVVPLNERPHQLHNWDAAPPGFERIRADIAKQTGLFPPPGNVAKIANFAPPVLDPARASMLAMLSGDMATSNVFVGGAAFGAAYAKHSKRIYVGNMPVGISEREIEDYFNSMLQTDRPLTEAAEEDAPVVGVLLSNDRTYAFVDLRTTELTNMALEMNGMQFNGSALKIKRPRDPMDTFAGKAEGGDDDGHSDTFVLSNAPSFFEEAHVRLLLHLIGDLKVFIFLRQRGTKKPLGITVFQYDENVFNEIARDVLAAVEFEGHGHVAINRLSECRSDLDTWSVLSAFGLTPDTVSMDSSNVVMLINLLPLDTLAKTPPAGFDKVENEVRNECSKYGKVKHIVLPRPGTDGFPTPGLGFCFVEYETPEEAQVACDAFSGRRFGEDIILTALYPKDRFDKRDF